MAKGQITKREAQVLDLMAEGLAAKQIGERLGISQRTIENHKQSIFKKTRHGTTTSAAMWWVLFGKPRKV